MALPWTATPQGRPFLSFSWADIPDKRAVSPSENGVEDRMPSPQALRPVMEQESYNKLYWARHFSVSDDNMAIAMGLNYHAAEAGMEQYNARVAALKNITNQYRLKTFGQGTYFEKLVRHLVET